MKKILFAAVISLFMASCADNEKKEDEASSKNAEMKASYEKNLATVKAIIAAFEKEDLNGVGAQIADTAEWTSPAYGDTIATKVHWMESLKYYLDNWSNLHLSNPIFLPGIDQVTHELDGSVRYYGSWGGVHSSGVATKLKFYGTYDFNADNKIVAGDEFFDLGGMMNAVQAKGK